MAEKQDKTVSHYLLDPRPYLYVSETKNNIRGWSRFGGRSTPPVRWTLASLYARCTYLTDIDRHFQYNLVINSEWSARNRHSFFARYALAQHTMVEPSRRLRGSAPRPTRIQGLRNKGTSNHKSTCLVRLNQNLTTQHLKVSRMVF